MALTIDGQQVDETSGIASLTLRVPLTAVAHRDRVLSFLTIVLPTYTLSRLSQRLRPLDPSWHESCSGKCMWCATRSDVIGRTLVEGAWVGSLAISFATPTAEELPCSLVYPQRVSWGSTRAAYYPRFERRRGKDPKPGGSCIHANCIVASLWTHEDRQETTRTY